MPTANDGRYALRHALITGTSSGLGHAIAARLLAQDWRVYGCSRRDPGLPGLAHRHLDLNDHGAVPGALTALLKDAPGLALVVLNAGILGTIRDISKTPLVDLKQVMELNVWTNKTVLDWLIHWDRPVAQIVLISSGASVLGNRGWGGYALSKATLNMLAKLYAHELPHTHISSLAPGIIDTAMMDSLCNVDDPTHFPALERLQHARGTTAMPGPDEAARRLLSVLPELREQPTGSFIDIREILEPDEYARLFGR
jgi:NAD(P)-dependent dehydrogenase (short-subunit alcohol dehydrogenase family)